MSISKLTNGHYQTRVRNPRGCLLTRVFWERADAEAQERIWKRQKQKITVGEFFELWHEDLRLAVLPEEDTGWVAMQSQLFKDYVAPFLGNVFLMHVTPLMVTEVLAAMVAKNRSAQTRRHVYNVMRRMFGAAIDSYQYLSFNPALPRLKPSVPTMEARYLRDLSQIRRLLLEVCGKPHELGVWIQIFLGLRIGELQALTWEEVDLESGHLSVRKTFVRKTNIERNYPKPGSAGSSLNRSPVG